MIKSNMFSPIKSMLLTNPLRGYRTVIFDKFEIFMGIFFLVKLCAKYNNTSYMIMPLCQKRFKYNCFNVFVTAFNMIKQKKIN